MKRTPDAKAGLRELIDAYGEIPSFSRGVSMLPLIREGKGYVSIVRADKPAINDILVFEQPREGRNVVVMHRLVAFASDGSLITRGDNSLECEKVDKRQVIGRANRIFWTSRSRSLLPLLLGAVRDENGGRTLPVDSPRYIRFVGFWNSIWPLRRQCYRLRLSVNRFLQRSNDKKRCDEQ